MDNQPATAGVLNGGREAFFACGPNFKQLGRLVAEISVETWFPIVTACWGPTIGFRCKPAVSPKRLKKTLFWYQQMLACPGRKLRNSFITKLSEREEELVCLTFLQNNCIFTLQRVSKM